MLIPVLGGKGKTFLISGILRKTKILGISNAAFIPFEADLTVKNIADVPTDAEIFAQSAGEGHFPFGLYTSYGPHPFRFSHESEGYKVKPEKVIQALKRCEEIYGIVWIELNGGLMNEISEGETIADWLRKLGNKALYVLDTDSAHTVQALNELELLAGWGVEVKSIVNNSTNTVDFHWIEYLKTQLTNKTSSLVGVLESQHDENFCVSDELIANLVKEFKITIYTDGMGKA